MKKLIFFISFVFQMFYVTANGQISIPLGAVTSGHNHNEIPLPPSAFFNDNTQMVTIADINVGLTVTITTEDKDTTVVSQTNSVSVPLPSQSPSALITVVNAQGNLYEGLINLTASNTVSLSQRQVLQVVKNRRAENSSPNFYIASTDHILNDGASQVDSIPTTGWAANGQDKWLVFVDEQPGKTWSHNCSYWYIPQQCSEGIIPSLHYEGYAPPISTVLKPIQQNVPWGDIAFANQSLRFPETPRVQTHPLSSSADTHVIVVGVINGLYDDMVRNWNACSSLYTVLRHEYNIPNENFHILMGPSDGMLYYYADPDDEYMTQTAMPRDLDGDGTDESILPGTWSNLKALMRTMNLFDFHAGNLFVYYVGASYNNTSAGVHVLFQDGYTITELMRPYFRLPNAPFQSMMLNCSNAGDLGRDLKHDRSVVSGTTILGSDCMHPNYPYYQSTYDWLCAIAQEDVVTGTPVNSDANVDGHVTFAEAANYGYGLSLYSSIPTNLGQVLAFDSIPAHDVLDITQVSSPTSEVTWNSPDVWVRNSDDGYTNQESEFLNVADDEPLYVYVRMHNSGNANYGMRMRMLPWNTAWYLSDFGYYGSYLWEVEEDAGALPGNSTISCYEWYPNPSFYDLDQTGNVLAMNYFMFYDQGFDYDYGSNYEDYIELNYNQLIKKKHVVIEPYSCATRLEQVGSGPLSHYVTVYGGNIPISLKTNGHGPYSIELLPDSAHMSGNPFTVGKMYIELSQTVHSSWQSGGSLSTGVTPQSGNSRKFKLDGLNSNFRNISLNDYEAPITFYADMVGTSINNVDRQFHIVLRDSSGTVIDGQSLRIIIDGSRSNGHPQISSASGNNGTYALSETNISEPAKYEWFDGNLSKVAEGKSVSVNASTLGNIAIVKVTRDNDGSVDYAVADINLVPEIDFVTPVPFSTQITVKLTAPAVSGMALRIVHVATGETHEYSITAGDSEKVINASTWHAGQYAVSLTHNGVNRNSVMILK